MISLRAATPDDAAAIVGFWNPMIVDSAVTFTALPKSIAEVAAMIAERQDLGHCFLVAGLDGQVVGFATYGPFRQGDGYARTVESTIILAPVAQGKGIAGPLMQQLQDHARGAGVHSIIAAIGGENPGALAFHQAIGFKKCGVVVQAGWKLERWMDLHLMQKLL